MTQPLKNSANRPIPPHLDLLLRRDRNLLFFDQKSRSDFRAWIASCLFHTTLLVLFALLWRFQTRGTSEEPLRPVGIAVVRDDNQESEYSLEGGATGAISVSDAASQSIPITVVNATGPPISIENIVSELIGNQTGPSETNPSQNGSQGTGLSGDGGSGSSSGDRGRGTGKKTKTSFFGVEGSGSSFVYVVDRSDSMNAHDAAPLRYAKRELLKSLESLNEYNQFQIVFYNDSLSPMSRKMFFATDTDKRRATNFVRTMPGDGGTAHFPALRQALAMSPEVLFFLTDADDPSLTQTQLHEIRERAELSRTTIHAVQFNLGPASNDGTWIRVLAEMNRGTYKYIDVNSFNKNPGE